MKCWVFIDFLTLSLGGIIEVMGMNDYSHSSDHINPPTLGIFSIELTFIFIVPSIILREKEKAFVSIIYNHPNKPRSGFHPYINH